MKVLEVKTVHMVRSPHYPTGTPLKKTDEFRASEGFELSLHESGLAAYIKGRDHIALASIASAVVVEEDAPALLAKKGGRK